MVSASSSSISTAASSSAAVTEGSCRTSWLQSALQVVQATLHHLMIVASHWPVQQKHDQAETTAWGLLQGCRQSPGRLNTLYVSGNARMHPCMSVADAPPP